MRPRRLGSRHLTPVWVLTLCLAATACLASPQPSAARSDAATAGAVRKAVYTNFQIMLVADKNTRDCYGCSEEARVQAAAAIGAIRRFTQLLKAPLSRRDFNALSAAHDAERSWGFAGFELDTSSALYDGYVHQAIRAAWRAAGLLRFRAALQILLLAADCPDWYLAVSLPTAAPVTACTY